MTLNRLFVVAVALSVAACSEATAPRTGPIAALPRPLSIAEERLVASGNDFSFALFDKVSNAQPNSNVFISPLSASIALGMTINGAAGETLAEMRAALRLGDLSEQAVNEGYRDLKTLLLGVDPTTQLRIANSIWHRAEFPFEQSFLTTAKSYFDAEVAGLDFDSPAAVASINDWAKRATNDRIPTVLEKIDVNTVMFLINALYFKGVWQHQFDPARTREQNFTSIDGAKAPVPLMSQDGEFKYLSTPEVQVVDLPYGNTAFTMTVLLPAPGQDINAFVANLSRERLAEWLSGLREGRVIVELPRFSLKYERILNEELKALGMRAPFFGGGADFTRMSPLGRDLFIQFVKQNTFVAVDEVGTEAAAVTTVGIGIVSAPPAIRVDRPFVFAIRERFSGAILFIGKIVRLPVA